MRKAVFWQDQESVKEMKRMVVVWWSVPSCVHELHHKGLFTSVYPSPFLINFHYYSFPSHTTSIYIKRVYVNFLE